MVAGPPQNITLGEELEVGESHKQHFQLFSRLEPGTGMHSFSVKYRSGTSKAGAQTIPLRHFKTIDQAQAFMEGETQGVLLCSIPSLGIFRLLQHIRIASLELELESRGRTPLEIALAAAMKLQVLAETSRVLLKNLILLKNRCLVKPTLRRDLYHP